MPISFHANNKLACECTAGISDIPGQRRGDAQATNLVSFHHCHIALILDFELAVESAAA